MNIELFLFDILKYLIAGLIIFFTAWYFVKEYLESHSEKEVTELKKISLSQLLPLRLQAYERIIIFIERIDPSNLLLRLHAPGINASEFHRLVLSDIRSEYQHNLSQQLYVSHEAWQIVKRLKEDTISLVNNAASTLPEDAAASELSKVILKHLSGLENDPYEAGLLLIKNDMQRVF